MQKAISIYKGGSSVILPKANDEDIICYYENDKDRTYALIHNHDHSKDYHFKLKENAKNIFIGCYAYPYMRLLEGEDLGLSEFDIHEHEKEYAQCLLKFVERARENDKRWYHIYLGYCALKNKNDFTKTQLEKAQEIHDNGISKTLVKNIIDYLTNIVNNKIEESN